MAESEQGGERTEEPSARRLQEARERGQVPRSRELTTFAIMMGGSATLVAVGHTLTMNLSHVMRRGMSIDAEGLRDPHSMIDFLSDSAISAATAVLPLFGCVVVVVLLASMVLG